MPRSARYLAALSQIDLKRHDEAFNTLKALQSDVRSAEVLNAMGVVQLRRGGAPQAGRATYYFSQASQTDTDDADYFFNLGYAYWIEKDPPAAIYWLREAVRRDPTDGDAHFVLAAALQSTGAVGRSRARARAGATAVVALRRRVGKDHQRRSGAARPRAAQGSSRAAGSAQSRRSSPPAVSATRRSSRRSIWRPGAAPSRGKPTARPSGSCGGRSTCRRTRPRRMCCSGGSTCAAAAPAEAIQAFKIALWSQDSAAGHVALAEAYLKMQNKALAKEEVDRALALDPASAAARALAETLAGVKPKR